MTAIKWDQPEMIREAVKAAMRPEYLLDSKDFDCSPGSYTRKNMEQFCENLARELSLRSYTEAPAHPAPSPELPDDVMEVVRWAASFDTDFWFGTTSRVVIEKARAILAELEPKPDPLAEVREDAARLYQEWLDDRRSAQDFLTRVLCAERGIELGERK